jgi:hypothetical protein
MKICPFCRKEIEKEAEKCLHCGRILIERIEKFVGNTPVYKKEQPQDYFKNIFRKFKLSSFKNIDWNAFKKYVPIIALIFLIILISTQKKHNVQVVTEPISTIPSQENTNNINTQPIKTQKSFVPVKDPSLYGSLPNGTVLTKNSNYLKGEGELNIDNGTDTDAVAKLVSIKADKSIYTVYVKANSKYTIKNISDDDYKLLFNLGNDWDKDKKAFLLNSGYEAFEEDFNFITSSYESGNYINTEYSTFSVTLNPVVNGQAKTEQVNPVEFAGY